jgi:hypothetical protein
MDPQQLIPMIARLEPRDRVAFAMQVGLPPEALRQLEQYALKAGLGLAGGSAFRGDGGEEGGDDEDGAGGGEEEEEEDEEGAGARAGGGDEEEGDGAGVRVSLADVRPKRERTSDDTGRRDLGVLLGVGPAVAMIPSCPLR